MRLCIVFALLLGYCEGFSVLIAVPMAIKSLHGMFVIIAKELVASGHQVTLISPYDCDSLLTSEPNFHLIRVAKLAEIQDKQEIFEFRSTSKLLRDGHAMMLEIVEEFWKYPSVKELWEKRHKFDLFMTMSYFGEATFPFLLDNHIPFVQFCTPGIESIAMSREGNYLSPSVVPNLLMNYDEQMSFLERSVNLPASIAFTFLVNYYDRDYTKVVRRTFPNIPLLASYYDRVSLTLINGHFALDGPVPLLPSQIEIGTINAKKPQPLPKDMEDFVQGSGDAGIIYFSLGSIAKSSQIPADAKRMFIEAFKIIPQRVLWKYEDKDLELPTTVKTGKWMPQQDILGHPKTRLFISHCGNLGTQEAKYHGVPVLAVPIAFDQPRNAARMARKGYALVLQWEALTVDTIVQAINTLINDTSYQERMDTVSRILQDQKDTPAERAVWWLEYVVRHKGAPHLQYAGKRLSLFQYVMLDVIFFWLAVLLFIIFVFVYVIKILCCSAKNTKKQNNKKKRQ